MPPRVILFFSAVCVIVLFFCIPIYSEWINKMLLQPNPSISEESKYMGLEERKYIRYGKPYAFYVATVATLKKANAVNPILFLPPEKYLKSIGITDMPMPEPSEFYYLTGCRSVWANSPDVQQASWALVPGNQKNLVLKKMSSKEDIDVLINSYKKFIP